jgi:sugar phosphate isomerase/epimerase
MKRPAHKPYAQGSVGFSRGWIAAAALGVSACATASSSGPSGGAAPVADVTSAQGQGAAVPDISKQLGVQLYSMRHHMEKDLPGTLRRVREMGYTLVEAHSFFGRTPEQFRAELDAAGLRAVGVLVPFKLLDEDPATAVANAKAIGAAFVGTAWIPHEGEFSMADAERAVNVFRKAGAVAKAAGLRIHYHLHGYEYHPGKIGERIADYMIKNTEPGVIDFELDVFYSTLAGVSAEEYLRTYPGRFPLLHLKDMRKGTPTGTRTGKTDPNNTVAVGSGIVPFAPIIRAAVASGAQYFFVEDESDAAAENLPQSLKHIHGLAGQK